MTDTFSQISNSSVLEALFGDGDGQMQKKAQAAANEYLRTKAREGAIFRQVLPPENIGANDLDPQVQVEGPAKVYEIEPYVPSAFTVSFGTEPEALKIAGKRGVVTFDEITTRKHRKNKFELMGYQGDLRQFITDVDVNEILKHEDITHFSAIDNLLSAGTNSPDVSLSFAGDVALWKSIAGGLTPETWVTMTNILPKSNSNFATQTVVMNQVLAKRLTAWEGGTELSDDLLSNIEDRGWVRDDFKGVDLIISIKSEPIADNEVYMFAAPKYLGKFYILQDIQMFPDSHANNLEWKSAEVIGTTIQPFACAKATLAGL